MLRLAFGGEIGEAPPMHWGIMFANTAAAANAEGAVALAQSAEECGVESLWTVEHVVVPVGYESAYPYSADGKMPGNREDFPIPDPLMWLAFVASATKRIRLATGVLILPQRNPVVLAKEVATLDHLSGGRVMLGIGVGWLEEEFDAIGVPFHERGARTDEAVATMRALWSTGDAASFEGKYTQFPPLFSRPTPTNGSVPIIVGGHTSFAAKRAGRLGNGFFPGKGSVEELSDLFALARAAAVEAGRDPSAIEFTTGAPTNPEDGKRLVDLGVTRFMIPPMGAERLRRFADTTMAAYE